MRSCSHAGRRMMKKWGFRRCEDIAWHVAAHARAPIAAVLPSVRAFLRLKQNCKAQTDDLKLTQNTVLQHTAEHCLMGIKGACLPARAALVRVCVSIRWATMPPFLSTPPALTPPRRHGSALD